MSPLTVFRNLLAPRIRRQPRPPRIVEILEERLLLTDVAFYDVLKGQNVLQSNTGQPVLQSGSPFHLHSSVDSSDPFGLSSATLRLPNATTKTLVAGPQQHLGLEQSFATKSSLDAAFAAGNYTFTIQHPISVDFSPDLDASAGVNLPAGSRTFGGGVVNPDNTGHFHEVWSPVTPNTLDVDGAITATTFTATLKGHVNTAVTGSINATWNGTAYVGTYDFNGASGNVSVPEGDIATLNLPSDAYPNAPHITDYTAAQSLNPAADFALTWDAFAGGTADDLVTLFIFDGNNQVFHTDATPLPTGSPHLDGTATSFVLPKNTLQANKTYNAQLWFQNFTSIDTTSFPGAKGATGYYIATNFTMKTGTAVDTGDPDVVAYYVSKAQEFVQADGGAPVLSGDTPFDFIAHVQERPTDGTTVNSATVNTPSNTPEFLAPNGNFGWEFFNTFDTKAALDTTYKSGKYTFSIDTVNQGLKSPAVTLPADAYPNTPHVSNWTDAQFIDATSDFTLNWDTFAGGTKDDFIRVSLVDQFGDTVFKTPNFWEANPLLGTARSVLIPAGTLHAGETYDTELLFANASTLDRTTYRGAIGTTAYAKATTFHIGTIPAEGLLQFSAGPFTVRENVATTNVTVSRIGGSAGEVSIHYLSSNGTATANSDYSPVDGTLTFADGEISKTFPITILDDAVAEGNETINLSLDTPTGGVLLGSRSTTTLTILDDELVFPPGNFLDSDGDKYTVKLTGPGKAVIALDDPDGDGKGAIAAIMLTDTTSASSLSITVTKVTGGDGKVPIGRVSGTGTLSSFGAAKSDLVGSGFNFTGAVSQITVANLLNGADIVVGGALANSTKLTLGDVAAGSEVRSGATLSALTAQSFLGNLIQAPAITALTINAGALAADLTVANAVKTLTVKAGSVSGQWTAASFGSVSITGGSFNGTLLSTASATQLGATAAVSSMKVGGGDFTGKFLADGSVGTFQVSKNAVGAGGSVHDATLTASGFSTITIGRDLVNAKILAGAKLGADGAVGGFGANADTFGRGAIGSFSVGGQLQSSVVGVGLDPMGEIFKNGNDAIVDGTKSTLKSFTVGGTASDDSYFRAGSLPTSVQINKVKLNPQTDARFNDFTGLADAAQTDDDGRVTLNIAGQSVPFQFNEEISGHGIPGLIVSVTTNTGTDGLALMLIVDPNGQYPTQVVVLHGDVNLSASPSVLRTAADTPSGGASSIVNQVIEVAYQGAGAITALHIGEILPPIEGPVVVVHAVEALAYAAKVADLRFGGAISRTAAQSGLFGHAERVDPEEERPKINERLKEQVKEDVAFITLGALFNQAFAGVVGVKLLADWGISYADDATVEQSSAPLYKIELLGKTFYFTDPDAHPQLSELNPIILLPEDRPDNILLIDKHHPDVAIKAVIGDGSQPIPVPVGDYEVVQKLPGRPPAITNVTVPPDGTTLPLSVPKPTIASLTLDATPRPTGFLDPGSQIRFTVVAKDANGNVIPNDQIDLTCLKPQVFNPVGLSGATVGTMGSPQFAIDQNTGQLTAVLTIGQANGAARVSARTCDGVSSNSILISGLGMDLFNMPIISFDSTELSIVEGSGGGTKDLLIPLSINKFGNGPVSVGFNTQDRGAAGVPASATSGQDYTSSVGTIKFSSLHATIKVPIKMDNITELNEQFVVGLLNPVNARLNIKNTAVCTIIDDDAALLSIADVKKNEGNSGTTNFVFTVKLSTVNSQEVKVDFATADGSASQSEDYTSTSGTLTFAPGETSKAITVAVRGDLDIENDETFFVNLSNPVQAALSNNQAIGTIVNDDRLQPGQVVVKIVGNGFVTDSTGQIDTRIGHNVAVYGSNDFPFLHASSPFVEWSDPSFFTQDPPLTPSDFANGLILTATFF